LILLPRLATHGRKIAMQALLVFAAGLAVQAAGAVTPTSSPSRSRRAEAAVAPQRPA
jgi:hypothetical protein